MRYLAIDYGAKYIGLAVCDRTETIASPLLVIEGQKRLPEKIVDIVKTENIEAIVLGLPLNMDDSQGPQAKLVFQFAEQLKELIEIPIHFQDERLTSFAAEQKLTSSEFRKKKHKKRLDAIAAAEILEVFLEQKNTQ
ncbi:MAG: Holliday junction resolvase RuvX [Planctomycetota bacterium]|jgi:putative Holliday junction resolvase